VAEPANQLSDDEAEGGSNPPSGPSIDLAGRFKVFHSTPVPELSSAHVRAYLAADERDPIGQRVALVCGQELPARLEMAKNMKGVERPGVLRLYDMGLIDWPGSSSKRLAFIYDLPEGGPLWQGNGPRDQWTAPRLVSHFLLPLANALGDYFLRNVTHRGIRPTNLYWLDEKRTRIVLGPSFHVPAGFDQPAVFEPIERAMADPEGRGPGTREDDMFALGMTLLAFAQGSIPGQGLDPDEQLARRIDRGSFDGLADLTRIGPQVMEALRGLCNDWEADRWKLEHLKGFLEGKRQQITPTAPSVLRAAKGFRFAGREYKTPRDLAHGLGRRWEQAATILRNGEVAMWIRNTLGDQKLHDRLMNAVREPSGDPNPTYTDALTVARASIVLDPMAPIRFRGHSVLVDGLGTALAVAMRKPGGGPIFADLIRSRVIGLWAMLHKGAGGSGLPQPGFVERIGKWIEDTAPGNGIERVLYELNPNLPCFSELSGGLWISEPEHVLEALEAAAGSGHKPIDRHIAAFLAVHAGADPSQIKALMNPEHVDLAGGMSILRLLSDLQERFGPPIVPRLTAWCATLVRAQVDHINHLPLRQSQIERLNKVSEEGNLKALLELVDNEKMREVDHWGFDAAKEAYVAAGAEIVEIRNGAKARAAAAMLAGKEAAALTSASLSGVLGLGSIIWKIVF
jgi:eukaryotic-like serine/threonine-protein kinase